MQINSKSVLMDPDFHDGHLTGLIMVHGTLELLLADIREKRWSLAMPEILAVSATNVLKANVVFEIEIFYRQKLTFDVEDSIDTSYFGEKLRDVANAVSQGKLMVVRIGSSFGADVVAVSTAPLDKLRITPLD